MAEETKFQITNPARFWIGVTLVSFEVIPAVGYALSLLDYSWITWKVLAISAVVLYNILAGTLIWNGSKQ